MAALRYLRRVCTSTDCTCKGNGMGTISWEMKSGFFATLPIGAGRLSPSLLLLLAFLLAFKLGELGVRDGCCGGGCCGGVLFPLLSSFLSLIFFVLAVREGDLGDCACGCCWCCCCFGDDSDGLVVIVLALLLGLETVVRLRCCWVTTGFELYNAGLALFSAL